MFVFNFSVVEPRFLDDILSGQSEEIVHTDTSAPQSNILATAASYSGIPGSTGTAVAVVHNPSPVARIKPLKVTAEEKKEGDSTSDSSPDSESSEDSDSYEAVDSSQEIHLTGEGKIFIHVFV